jgi:CheY-like chemotaxis protein
MELDATWDPRGRQRVLVVDDAALIRYWMQQKLGDRYDVSLAADGDEAITVALDVHPDLILLDVEMPRMDGFSTCRVLRNLPSTRATPIIMVTSRIDPSDVEQGFSCGCTDFIGKPVDELELAAKVESWVGAAGEELT